jgi:hypothetical protein
LKLPVVREFFNHNDLAGSRMKVAEWSKKNRADRQLERAAREGTLQVR